MNSKRQTIWLVSMLSLMVVLSAYYLFTEDVDKLNKTAEQAQSQTDKNIVVDTTDGDITSVISDKTGATDIDSTEGLTDAEILQQLANQGTSGNDYFANEQLTRDDELYEKLDALQTVMADTKQSVEIQTKAYEDYSNLETIQGKQTHIEERLLKDGYTNVLLKQDGGKWIVVVQADKLERSQAVSIVDLVTDQMNVGVDKVSVQYKK